MRILLVEDNEALGVIMARIARSLDNCVTSALSGEEAVEILLNEREAGRPFDVLITDQELGGLSGIDLIRLTKEQSPNTACVLMSGHFDLVDGEAFAGEHGARYIEKPFWIDPLQELLTKIENEQ